MTQTHTDPDALLAKLLQLASDDADMIELLELALEKLPWRDDEKTAAQLLLWILFHDNLAETLNGRL